MGQTAAIFSITSSLGQAFTSLSSGGQQADAFRDEAEFQEMQFEFNRDMAELNADEVLRQGHEAAIDVRKQAKMIVGSQRAAYAGQGVDVNEGTALRIQEDTYKQSEDAVLTIKNNAQREAFGYKLEAISASIQGAYTRLAATNRANAAILAGQFGFTSGLLGAANTAAKNFSFPIPENKSSSLPGSRGEGVPSTLFGRSGRGY